MTTKLFMGFDPGGAGSSRGCIAGCRGHFGWSVCCESAHGIVGRLDNGLSTDAWGAVKRVKAVIEAQFPEGNCLVVAAGIDVPLLWNKKGDNKGTRNADIVLRQALNDTGFPRRSVGGTVQAINSLRGADVVQGLLVARHLREKWDLMITESHPKAFHHLLFRVNHPQLEAMVSPLTMDLLPHDRNNCESQHEIDATMGAITAWAAIRCRHDGHWRNLYTGDLNLFNPSGVPVSYWMPIP